MSQLIDNIYYSDDMKEVRGAYRTITTAVIKDGVTCIYWEAFAWCRNLQSVVLPDSVVKIDDKAFSSCSNLESIVISKNLVSIGKYSFSDCENLTKLDLPDTLTSIDKDAFAGCKKLKEVHFGGNIEKLSGQLFDDCPEVELYAPAKSLTEKAIKKNAKLKQLYKKSEIEIQTVSFESCMDEIGKKYPTFKFSTVYSTKTKHAVFIKAGKNVSVIQLSQNASSWSKDFQSFLSVFCDESKTNEEIEDSFATYKIKTVVIKNEFSIPQIEADEMNLFIDGIQNISFFQESKVKKITFARKAIIGNYAFSMCENLQSVVIPEGVTSIGNHAFSSCENLQSIVIPGSVTSIGSYAFYDCINLQNVIIPSNVTSIGSWAFYNCGKMKNIDIPDGITSIEKAAFAGAGCEDVQSITIPDSVTSIEDRAFCGCKNLKSIIIPDSVTSIGSWAFRFDDNLTITFNGTEESWKKIKGVKDVESDLGDNQIKFTR